MGSPAFVGIQEGQNGPIRGIIVHNGYFEFLGPRLYEHWHNHTKAQELVDLGDLSKIGKGITKNEGTEAYVRDWNRNSWENRTRSYTNRLDLHKKMRDSIYSCFLYANGGWYVSIDGRWYTPLHEALDQMGIKPEISAHKS